MVQKKSFLAQQKSVICKKKKKKRCNNPLDTEIFTPLKGSVGNTTNRISLPNSDGVPLFCGWEPLRLSGCLSAVPGIHLACSRDGSKEGPRWAAVALPAWHRVAFSAAQGAVRGEPAVRPGKGQACQTGSVCVSCSVLPLECAVSQGRSGAGRPALFRGFFGGT